MFRIRSIKFLFLAFLLIFTSNSNAQKISPEDIVTKHLDSIGTKEKREAIKNQLVYGDVNFTVRGSAVPVSGKVVIFSAGEKNVWGMNLNSNDYPLDRFGFDGKDTRVGYTRPGVRSILGGFILSYRELLKEGLLGGTLTSSWALLDTDSKKPKLSYEGTKKIDGKEAHVLSYSVRSGSDLNIKMYFDAKNYQHIRTEYSRLISARQGSSIDNSAGQGDDRYRLVEIFSDFKKAGSLILPTKYVLSYDYSSSASIRTSQNAPRYFEWRFDITNFSYDQQMDDAAFNIDAK
jgi:hypothetical protein